MKFHTCLVVALCVAVLAIVQNGEVAGRPVDQLKIPMIPEDDNPCVYIGRYYMIDVREVAEEIKYDAV